MVFSCTSLSQDFVPCIGIFMSGPFTEMSEPFTLVRRLFTEMSEPFTLVRRLFTEVSGPFTEVSGPFTKVNKPFTKMLVEDFSSVGFSVGFSVGKLPVTC